MQGMLRSIVTAACLALAGAVHASGTIGATEVAAMLGGSTPPLVLDVRSESEFAEGHVPGAVLIPHDVLEARIGELGAPREIVVYCRSGRRVELVRPLLETAGFSVRAMQGSFIAWQAADLPVVQPSHKERAE